MSFEMTSVIVSPFDFCRLASPNQSEPNSMNSQKAPTHMPSNSPNSDANWIGSRWRYASRYPSSSQAAIIAVSATSVGWTILSQYVNSSKSLVDSEANWSAMPST